MEKHAIITLAAVALLSSCRQDRTDTSMTYFFDRPASVWEETFPLGNGRIGMMPDGGIREETFVLNEISMWSGSPQNADNPEALKHLGEIRNLLFQGRNDEAQELMYDTFSCGGSGTGHGHGYNVPYGSFQLFGNLRVSQKVEETDVTGYRRELNLKTATVTESFTSGGIKFTRMAFSSFSEDINIIKYSADADGALNLTFSFDRKADIELPAECTPEVEAIGRELIISGRMLSGNETAQDPAPTGLKYGGRIKIVLPRKGTVDIAEGNKISVSDADEVMVLISMGTEYFGEDVEVSNKSLIDAASLKLFPKLYVDHIRNFSRFFDRVSLDFGHIPEKEALPMDARLRSFQQDGNDPSLPALFYQFGRYLLISSSRPGCLPPNLQGLWANTIQTPWNGDYHTNINIQMNLWPAETGNLPEMHLPLIELTKSLIPSGQHTAQVFYGARGWTAHTPVNVWGFTSPGEHPSWGASNTSAAWLCEHLYQHYEFSQDKEYLADVYPTMKEAALFFDDVLVEDPVSHYLVSAPTNSPENAFYMENGQKVNVCAGSTMDNQIIRELFTNVASAAGILGIDREFADTLTYKASRLKPTTISDDGRIMEWMEPYREVEIHHRHVSHLYGLHPANEISVNKTPELAEAARKTLEVRGDLSTGWSMAWKINFWARLKDGERCFKLLKTLLKPIFSTEANYHDGGGTYPNLFGGHPPFQIDSNFGAPAGIAEMLIQSQDGFIELIPALPQAWKDGSFKGLCVRGGAEVSAAWQDGVVTSAELTAKADGEFLIKDLMTEPVRLKAGQKWNYRK